MRFLGGKNRKEFEEMAEKDEYIEEAYGDLKKLSLDEQKRLVETNIAAGKSLEEIAEFLGIDLSEVRALADEAN